MSGSGNKLKNNRRRSNTTNRRRSRERAVPGLIAHPDVEGPLSHIDAERTANQRWAGWSYLVVGVVIGLIFAAFASIASPIAGAIVFPLIVVVSVWRLRRSAPRAVIRAIGAAPVEEGSAPRVATLLEGMSATVGVATPEVRVLIDDIPNAAALGAPEGPVIVLTTGVVNALSVVELEGVLAHLLSHQRTGSNVRGTMGAGLALLGGPLTRSAARSHKLIGRGRLLRADEVGVLATRYPPGLASALSKMEHAPLPQPGSFFASDFYATLRWLFVDPSIGRRALTDEVGDTDATGVRRRVLDEA